MQMPQFCLLCPFVLCISYNSACSPVSLGIGTETPPGQTKGPQLHVVIFAQYLGPFGA